MGRPKGSKNQAKPNKKAPKRPKNSDTEDIQATGKLCVICGRVAFGDLVTLPFNKFRHADCAAGSIEWDLYYQNQSVNDRKVLSEFYNYYKGVNYD